MIRVVVTSALSSGCSGPPAASEVWRDGKGISVVDIMALLGLMDGESALDRHSCPFLVDSFVNDDATLNMTEAVGMRAHVAKTGQDRAHVQQPPYPHPSVPSVPPPPRPPTPPVPTVPPFLCAIHTPTLCPPYPPPPVPAVPPSLREQS
nr:WAS/WASL-interacting protein family member 3-like [Penaeus vannamei]